tara:strand:- start:2901 stop:3827 length:927 start_codon:yes stop_codon:yes gene_type:complete
MKKIYTLLLGAAFAVSVQGQLVIDESFEIGGEVPADWTAIDEDGITPNEAGYENWLVDTIGTGAFYEGRVFAISQSWLEGFAPGNRNWLISPAITVASDDYEYAWGGCPAQGTIYMDGYKIMLSTSGTDLASFTETLATYAQNINDAPGEYSDGIVHTAFEGDPTDGANPASGILRHHSVDLSAYNGQTVHVAILHDSDDDFRLYVDYIKAGPAGDIVSIDELTGRTFEVNVYPNPAANQVNISFDSNVDGKATLQILNSLGQVIEETSVNTNVSNTAKFNVSEYATGVYTARLNFGANIVDKRFVVQ